MAIVCVRIDVQIFLMMQIIADLAALLVHRGQLRLRRLHVESDSLSNQGGELLLSIPPALFFRGH
jgi:hypothetical protein